MACKVTRGSASQVELQQGGFCRSQRAHRRETLLLTDSVFLAVTDIYTGRGDEGMTDLMNTERTSKSAARIEAYGTVDELNSTIGVAHPTEHDDIDDTLAAVQNHLHIIQSRLSHPNPGEEMPSLEREHVDELEERMDKYDDELEELESFILPGGGVVGSRLHQARSVARRAERRAVELAETDGEQVEGVIVTYLNRLSDLLFVLARTANQRDGHPERSPTY